MKKTVLKFMLTIWLIISCSLLLFACNKDELIYFDTDMPSEYEIELEYASENLNFTSTFIKKGNEYYCKRNTTGSNAYYAVDYYVLTTDRAEKPYNYYSYNYLYEEWSPAKYVEKYDSSLFGGTVHPSFDDSFIFGILDDLIDTNTTPFEQSEFVEDCVVAGRSCTKYQIKSSDGSSSTYSYDKVTSALLEKVFVDNDGDNLNQSFTLKVTKFSTSVADDWKDKLSPTLPRK